MPTGIPLRRMWIHLRAADADNNTVFESGSWDSEGRINGMDLPFERHYNVIDREDEVQIYEAVPIDINGNVTNTLLRASTFIKDNRIPPLGFKSSHISYDTTAVYGYALNDPDFNKANGNEGTGTDVIKYRIPVNNLSEMNISAEVCYQTLKPEVAEYLGEMNSLDINRFNRMYEAADKDPVIMKSKEIHFNITGNDGQKISSLDFSLAQNYPNPFNPSTKIRFTLPHDQKTSLALYDVLGKEISVLINSEMSAGNYEVNFDGSSLPSGIYFYRLTSGNYSQIRKMLLVK